MAVPSEWQLENTVACDPLSSWRMVDLAEDPVASSFDLRILNTLIVFFIVQYYLSDKMARLELI